LAGGLLTAGCFPFWLFDDWRGDTPTTTVPPRTTSTPPSIDNVDVADWPPLGPEGTIGVDLSDDRSLSSVSFDFNHSFSRVVSGTAASIEVSGTELGEGLGKLTITAMDSDGGWAQRWVENLLVDLTPPEVTIGKTVLPQQGDNAKLEIWVADAWVLGHVDLEFNGSTLSHDFGQVYPETLGTAWDYSLVSFPTSALAAGTGTARITAYDAAGNATIEQFELSVDGNAPLVSILAPAPNQTVSGLFQVSLSALDPEGGPCWIQVKLGGTDLGTAVGPSAKITVDASEFVPGELTLEATAVDEAGNESLVASVPIVIAQP